MKPDNFEPLVYCLKMLPAPFAGGWKMILYLVLMLLLLSIILPTAGLAEAETLSKYFTKLPDPADLPTGSGFSTAFSHDSTYLAAPHYNSPYIIIYKDVPPTLSTYVGVHRDNTFYLDYDDKMAWDWPGDKFGNFGISTDEILLGSWEQ